MADTLVAARGAQPAPAYGPEAITRNWENQKVSTGTTLMAVQFDWGVVLGADSRTTTESYIANRVTDKLTPIHDRIFCCRSGSAADSQAVALGFHSIERNEPPLVHTSASLFKEMSYRYPEDLTARIIITGWDPQEGGQLSLWPWSGTAPAEGLSVCSVVQEEHTSAEETFLPECAFFIPQGFQCLPKDEILYLKD
uniref:Proteasome subunit beta n=1 Tax=Monodon monoceros TaxID=40151 RepID=A0A8C6BSN6_MONMO